MSKTDSPVQQSAAPLRECRARRVNSEVVRYSPSQYSAGRASETSKAGVTSISQEEKK
jgi:hypothetical protein